MGPPLPLFLREPPNLTLPPKPQEQPPNWLSCCHSYLPTFYALSRVTFKKCKSDHVSPIYKSSMASNQPQNKF